MTHRRVVVVGAGIGGLACALELAARGVEVLVLERAAQPGGKLRQVEVGGVAMDAGPTVFTMRWVFDALFEAAGARLADHLALHPASVLARHAWSGTERLDLFADVARSADAIGHFAGAGAARGYLEFCGRAAGIYRALEGPFLQGERPTPLDLVARAGVRGLPGLMRISPFGTLWSALGRHFTDPRLQQLFGRYATYCGASPFQAAATLMLVAHVEQRGVWRVEGGMQRIAQALAALAAARGATLRFGAPVERIRLHAGRACGVRLADGEVIDAQAVVFNGDTAALASGLLGAHAQHAAAPTPAARRSLSAITWSVLAPTDGFALAHHNVFFSDDSRREFADLFERGRLPTAPTVYVCAQDRGEPDAPAPVGAERMLLIVNAPACGDARPFTPEELARCEAQTFRTMAHGGLRIPPEPANRVMTTPHDFERLFPATGGALYGPVPHGWRASFQRPGSRSRLPGLYLTGGSVHPGPGVPMAALSGRRAAASVLADLALNTAPMPMPTTTTTATPNPTPTATPFLPPTPPSIPRSTPTAAAPRSTTRSRPAATPGGTSTR